MNATVTQIADRLIGSYAKVGGINHLDGANLPSKTGVAAITLDLLRLLFPGFFDEQSIHSSELKVEMTNLVDAVAGRLEDEVCKSLQARAGAGKSGRELRAQAHERTVEFMLGLPRLRELLATDVEAAYTGDPAAVSREEVILAYPFIETIAVQRMAHELYRARIPFLPRIMTEWAHSRTGIDLHPGARIGSHFFIDHGTGTVLGETCEIGHHVKIYHGVTLGAKSTARVEELRGHKRHPTIEDHVTIYPGATILGGETVIGAGSTIGGNVFLLASVPPNSLVLAEEVKVRVLSKDGRKTERADFQI